VKNQSNYQEALQHYLEAYRIWKELNDTTYFCRALNNIGITYKNLSMYSLAMSSYQEIIDTNPSKDPYAIPLALANMATIYSQKKDLKKANDNIDLAIQKIDSIGNFYYNMALKNIKGNILIDEGKYDEAKPFIEEALKVAKERNFSNDYGVALTLYSDILYNTHKYSEALSSAKIALKKAQENSNTKHSFSNTYLIGKILVKQGQDALAASYLLESLSLNDSIKAEEDDHNLMEAALSYEIGKKEAINESLKKETELNKTIINKTKAIVKLQKLYIVVIALFLAFSLLFLVIVIRNYRIRTRLNKDLNDSNLQINEKNEKLHELVNINSKIFSIISHDLKAPMISLHNSITLLRDADLDYSLKEKVFKSTEIQVNSTIDLLENLLKWAKTHGDGIKVKLQRIDTHAVVQQNLNLIKVATLNKQLHVVKNCGEGIEALGDMDLINLIIRNLLSNAIKFTPRKGKIKISTELTNHNVIISVTDSGVGISEEDKTKIFCTDEFVSYRGTENEPGTGLGLKLCLNFIKYMNGEFEIKSVLGKGSTFIVSLPKWSNSKTD
jgi:signal transduction histidine kinase